MYKEIIKSLTDQINEVNKQITDLQKNKQIKIDAKEAIKILQAEYERDNNNLAVQKGICPFPENCKLVKECVLNYCSADCCDNGYAYRMS